ncbi:MAG: rhodanese-like domain-containing protein [Anaerolineales bacterium]
MRFLFAPMILMLVALAACAPAPSQQVDQASDGYRTMDVRQLHTELQSKDFVFVNVHIPFEGDIAGTDLSIPYDKITQPDNLSLLPADKNAKIVLYCRSGRMSAIAAQALAEQGYTNVWDIPGGMVEWEAAGFDLQR